MADMQSVPVASSLEEQRPLLGQQVTHVPQDTSYWQGWRLLPTFQTVSPRFRWVPVVGLAILLLNEVEFFLKQTAQVRAFEAMACQEYYRQRDQALFALGRHIPEILCKKPAIQKSVAQLSGLALLVRMGSAAFGTLLLSRLADKIGRRPVLIAHKINLVIMNLFTIGAYLLYPRVPIWTICMSGITGLVGGNFDLGFATMLAAYTDVIPSPAQRSTLFFIAGGMQFAAQLISLPVSARLMNLDGSGGTPEVSIYVSLIAAVLTVILTVMFFPETLGAALRSSVGGKSSINGTRDLPGKSLPTKSSLRQFGPVPMVLMLLSITCSTSGLRLVDWYGLIQFPPVKFGWTISEVTNTLTLQAVTGLVTTTVFLPVAYRFMGSAGIVHGDRVRVCAPIVFMLLATIGSVLLGLSTRPISFVICMVLYTLASAGTTSAIQTCISCIVTDPQSMATIMGVLSLAGTLGKVNATVLWPILLSVGLDSGHEALKSLGFFVSAGLDWVAALIFAAATWTIARKGQSDISEVEVSGGVEDPAC